MKVVITALLCLLLALAVWLGMERGILYWELHSPIPKSWMSVRLVSGEVFYGLPGGISEAEIRLMRVYTFEKYTKKDSGAALSGGFELSGTISPAEDRYFPSYRSAELLLNRSQVLYWEYLPSDSSLLNYLK